MVAADMPASPDPSATVVAQERAEGGRRLLRLVTTHLDAVLELERDSYDFPWSRGNFIDSLAAGYLGLVAFEGETLVAYLVAMPGVGEMHLLNLSVAPSARRRGHAQALLDALEEACRREGLPQLWLEVREGNAAARALYRRRGFEEMGVRRGYYPATGGRREDAVLMRLCVPGALPYAVD
jgi:ribosomal-protein-alanine N-acetyltransferase